MDLRTQLKKFYLYVETVHDDGDWSPDNVVDKYLQSQHDGKPIVMRPLPPLIEIEQALNLAQAELRSMYKRAGFKGSNVLSLVDAAWTKVKAAMPS